MELASLDAGEDWRCGIACKCSYVTLLAGTFLAGGGCFISFGGDFRSAALLLAGLRSLAPNAGRYICDNNGSGYHARDTASESEGVHSMAGGSPREVGWFVSTGADEG